MPLETSVRAGKAVYTQEAGRQGESYGPGRHSGWKGTLILGSSSEHQGDTELWAPYTQKTNFCLLPFLCEDPVELSTEGWRETCSAPLSSPVSSGTLVPTGVGKKILFTFFIPENQ